MGKFYLDLLLWWEIVKAIRSFKPDVIHGHLHEGALLGLLARPFAGGKPPVVFDVQGSLLLELDSYGWLDKAPLVRPLFNLVEKVISRWSDYSVGSNINISKFLVEEMGLRADKVCTIIDGVHMGFFDGTGEDNLKAKLGIAPERPIVLYTGALLSSKGSDNYFEAIPHVLKERPDAFFLVVGYTGGGQPGTGPKAGSQRALPVRGQGGLLQAAGLFKNRRCGG
jgi:glycosyltransferase involved in cell wall biosynthesis